MPPGKFFFPDSEAIGRLSFRSSGSERPYHGQESRVFPPHEILELLKKCRVANLFFGSTRCPLQVCRMGMAVFVIHGAEVFPLRLSVERDVSWTAQGIMHALRIHGAELVGETEIHIVLEPGLVCAVVLNR